MKIFRVSPAVPVDLREAYDYFNRGGRKTAERFLARFEAALRLLQRQPEICRLRQNSWRQLPIPRSSYAIFYREAPDFWIVAAVISTVRDPDVIQAQLLIREISDHG